MAAPQQAEFDRIVKWSKQRSGSVSPSIKRTKSFTIPQKIEYHGAVWYFERALADGFSASGYRPSDPRVRTAVYDGAFFFGCVQFPSAPVVESKTDDRDNVKSEHLGNVIDHARRKIDALDPTTG
ncbi:hypothetical protein [Paraburkholderia sp. JHI869]|uniref:hypothetical protein n=1 Tax=Paraburkholderia sp. JHI869 TaxID=3112959 RepID=UPI0031706576